MCVCRDAYLQHISAFTYMQDWNMKPDSRHNRENQRIAFAGLLVLLLPIFSPNLFNPLARAFPSLFSEWNAPKPRHLRLLQGALRYQISDRRQSDLWSPLANQGWKPCVLPKNIPSLPKKSQGYIQVFLDGGLNQQRMGICDAVAVAKILNATLLIPQLEVNPVWQDLSSFSEIFDVDHFINALNDEVSIVKELPSKYSWSTREYYATGIRATRIKTAPVHASANWYLENVLPMLQSYGIAAIAPFSHRLAFDNLPSDIQHLRCKVNFQALVFVPHIRLLGEALINGLRNPSKSQVIWQGRVLNAQFTDEELRNQGRCPLTPEEIGLLLAALGFTNNTRLYLASHKVYGGEARISTLRKLFPLMEDKKSLTTAEERSKVEEKASLLAAVDYYVSMHSDIFISASPGNMHNAMLGYRAYKNLKTIRPNMALLGKLFLNNSMECPEFQQAVQDGHKSRQGQIRLRKEKQSIYTYPARDCMCQA
ncbi:GDP-fucose protein O-fucosyltransferase protein [Actinidia chinensis var. chinensis]|uniref:O-fucosyltransferase family protein n=1 Tax=Actinidia chinensis var. chinensis TaxID=1590841 RepID=A0A2R6RNJ4_ACTCC|nr:GDP-fucose protein O-fucosyltransferase protein [Actinidia chinensis var. chinensis]